MNNHRLDQTINLARNEGFVEGNQPLDDFQSTHRIDMELLRGISSDLEFADRSSKARETATLELESFDTLSDLKITEDVFTTALQIHVMNEPHTATVGASIAFPITFLDAMEPALDVQVDTLIRKASLLRPLSPAVEDLSALSSLSEPLLVHLDPTTHTKIRAPANKLSDSRPAKLYIFATPVFLAHYESPSHKAVDQAYMSYTSSIMFMRKLGISDATVFGLIVRESVGQLIMCWNDPPLKHSGSPPDDYYPYICVRIPVTFCHVSSVNDRYRI